VRADVKAIGDLLPTAHMKSGEYQYSKSMLEEASPFCYFLAACRRRTRRSLCFRLGYFRGIGRPLAYNVQLKYGTSLL